MSSSATLLVSSVRISWVVIHLFHLNTLFRVLRVSKIIHVLCLFIYAVVSDIVCIITECVCAVVWGIWVWEREVSFYLLNNISLAFMS